jgi:SsrA-binding protein
MKIVAKNKRARFDYQIKETLIAGLVLAGHEVKSVKSGHISLKGSFVSMRSGEAWLTNAHITQYKQAANLASYDPERSRKLLLHRKQIDELLGAVKTQGNSVVPLAVGIERGLVKVELGIGRGKKNYDKRETIKRSDMLRDADREVSSRKHRTNR